MRISKKQQKFIALVEKCENKLFVNEINYSEFPQSMIDAIVNKGLLKFSCGHYSSTTAV